MDSGRILVALQEQEKWRDRRARLVARLKSVQARKRFLQRELEATRRKSARLEESLIGASSDRVSWDHSFARVDR